jgi:methylmalonyl-CoA/ethylmalonyl-CoA epimerase
VQTLRIRNRALAVNALDNNPIIQIGVVVNNVDRCVERYGELLGWKDWHFNTVDTTLGKGRNFIFAGKPIEARARIAWTVIGQLELELIEPQDEHSIYAEFLRQKGPGLHHVMIEALDFRSTLADFAKHNCDVLASGELQNTRFALVDTLDDLGLLIEIAEGGPLIPDSSLSRPA